MKTNNTPSTMNEQTKQYFRNVYGSYENLCEQADEYLARLHYELQQYHDNASKGGANRQINMAMLAEDIARLERQLKAIFADEATAILNAHNINRDSKFRYMLLGRMQSDCESYIYAGVKRLWANNKADHIAIMRAIWYTLPSSPKWLTLEQIDRYAAKMNVEV